MSWIKKTPTVLVALAACGLVACQDDTTIGPEPGTGGTGAGGGAAAAAGTGGGGLDASGEGECPKGLAGPDLVKIPAPEGGHYCIDAREVVNSEYAVFLKAMGSAMPEQPAECKLNTQLTPKLFEEGEAPIGCYVGDWVAYSDPDFAVRCVDFCDAFAYCKWAGKRLCGERGKPGAAVNVFSDADALKAVASSTKNEWFNACSNAGATKYPYGDAYVAGRCVDQAKYTAEGKSALAVKDVESDTCVGKASPFDAVHHLSGNVLEWSNLCRDGGGSCKVQGGDFGSPASQLECGAIGVTASLTNSPRIGFRCCADTVAP